MTTPETTISTAMHLLGRQRRCPAVCSVARRLDQGYVLLAIVHGTWSSYTGKIWTKRLLARHPTATMWEPIAFGFGQGNDQIAVYATGQ